MTAPYTTSRDSRLLRIATTITVMSHAAPHHLLARGVPTEQSGQISDHVLGAGAVPTGTRPALDVDR